MEKVDKFLELSKEKKIKIIDAGLLVFGKMGYKKASAQDIAKAAGISKAMVFHYFGNKKSFYLYLLEYAGNFVVKEIENHKELMSTADFFERIKLSAEIKLETINAHPGMLSFFTSVFFENDPEIATEIKEYITESEKIRKRLMQTEIDMSKFKEEVDPNLVMKLLLWAAEGYASSFQNNSSILKNDLEEFMKDFNACLDLMKINFYK